MPVFDSFDVDLDDFAERCAQALKEEQQLSRAVTRLLKPDRDTYAAADVVRYLLSQAK